MSSIKVYFDQRMGMRLPIRMKMFTLVAIVLLLAIGALLWKTSGIFQQDKALFVREYADRFTGTVARFTADRIQTHQNNIAVIATNRDSVIAIKGKEGVGAILFERFPDFLAAAVVTKKENSWTPEWIEVNPNSNAKSWTQGFDSTLVRSINYDEVARTGLYLSRLSQPSGLPAYSLAYTAEVQKEEGDKTQKSILVGILAASAFEDIIRDFKGDISEVFIVDQRGFVYAHPDPKYMGANIENHPLVSELKTLQKESATGEYKDMQGEPIIGSYKKVKGTNLFVANTTLQKEAFRAAQSLVQNVIVFGSGFVVIGLVFAVIISSRITNPLHKLQSIAIQIGSGNFSIPVDVKTNDEVGELASSIEQMKNGLIEREEQLDHSKQALIQSEKMSAFGQLSAGIAHEVKNPLAGILGHAQLAKSKADDPDLKKHIEVIEKETRRTKEIIENLMKFARAEKAELVPTDLHETVSATVDLVEHQLNLMGVQIIKQLSSVPVVNANSNQLQQVLLNIAMNAGHAMEKSEKKELTVFLEHVDQVVRIRLQDTGAGMTPEVQKRIFEPFFTTKPAGKGTGLGLSVSIGIVRDHHGKIYVKSEVGKGTTFFIDLPLAGAPALVSQNGGAPAPVSNSQAKTPEPLTVSKPAAASQTLPPTPPKPPKPPEPIKKMEPVATSSASVSQSEGLTGITKISDMDMTKTKALPKDSLSGLGPKLTDKPVADVVAPQGMPSAPFGSVAKPPPLDMPKSDELAKAAQELERLELEKTPPPSPPKEATEMAYDLEPPAVGATEGTESSDEEFKVNIRRPKLKV